MSRANDPAIEADKLKKSAQVARLVAEQAASSSFPDLRRFHEAIQAGDELVAQILTGGLTNYSFKVALKQALDAKPVFAKLCFPFALWNPDPDQVYDLERTENEAHMMQIFADVAPGCVAQSYCCIDVLAYGCDPAMKLLVAEWCIADEQFANQWIDGNIDLRIAKPLGDGIAKLHSLPVQTAFNEGARPALVSLWSVYATKCDELLASSDDSDRFVAQAKEFGHEKLAFLFQKNLESYSNDRQGLIHSDFHCFNILSERKPDPNIQDSFGPGGRWMLCDWEMAVCGPIGRDMGVFLAFPISCVVAHAANTRLSDAYKLLNVAKLIVNEYIEALKGYDKTATYKAIMGWLGWFLFTYIALDVHLEFLPIARGTKRFDKLKEAIGVMSLKFLELGFDDTADTPMTLSEMRFHFDETIAVEIIASVEEISLKAWSDVDRSWQSSRLRASGIIVSDNHYSRDPRFRTAGKAVMAMNRFKSSIA